MKKLFKLIGSKVVRPIPLGVVLASITTLLLSYKLLDLVPFGNMEQPQQLGSANLSQIKDNILYAPIKGLQLFILKFSENDAYIRYASVVAGLTAAVLLYLMLRKWYTARVSVLTTVMFICSSLFLHLSRSANLEVLYLSVVPALLLICMWFLSKKHDNKLPVSAVMLGLLLYIPGSWAFIAASLIVFRKFISQGAVKVSKRLKLISLSLFTVTIAPLIYSFVLGQRQIVTWLGYDLDQSFSAMNVLENLADIPKQLFFTGFDNQAVWLVGTPVLDVFTIVMLVLGFYAYRVGHYPAREQLLLVTVVLSIILIAMGNVVTLAVMLPILYVVIANGIAYMLQSWFTVFPRNPVARTTGVILLAAIIGVSCFYHLQRYYVAWPDSEATKDILTSQS